RRGGRRSGRRPRRARQHRSVATGCRDAGRRHARDGRAGDARGDQGALAAPRRDHVQHVYSARRADHARRADPWRERLRRQAQRNREPHRGDGQDPRGAPAQDPHALPGRAGGRHDPSDGHRRTLLSGPWAVRACRRDRDRGIDGRTDGARDRPPPAAFASLRPRPDRATHAADVHEGARGAPGPHVTASRRGGGRRPRPRPRRRMDRAGRPPHDGRAGRSGRSSPDGRGSPRELLPPLRRPAVPVRGRNVRRPRPRHRDDRDGQRWDARRASAVRDGRPCHRAGRGVERRLGVARVRRAVRDRGRHRPADETRGRDRASARGRPRHGAAPTTGRGRSVMLAEQDFRYIQDLVRERAAIVLEPGKEYLAVTRLDPLVRRAGLGSLSELVAALREGRTSALHEDVVDALTTNETTWFRDVHPFESLRTHVLPDLIERKRLSRTLCIWSAGCSSGQEPYSVAMLVRDEFPELDGWQISITGTDVSAGMLERAQAGRYGQIEVNRGLPAHLLVKHFRRVGVGWELDAGIRSMVRFQRQSLMEPWTNLPPMDLVLMRNVMTYFDVATKREALGRVRD